MKLLESIDSFLLLENCHHIDSLRFSFLEAICVECVALSEADDSLLANVQLGRGGELGDVWDGLRLDSSLDSREEALVSVVLDESLHLIISVKVHWVPGKGDFVLLVLVVSESLHNESHLDPSIRSKNVGTVHLVDLKVPRSDDDYLLLQIGDVDVREFRLEVINSFLSEIAWHKEEPVSHQEVGE